MPGGRPKAKLDLKRGWKEAVLSEYEDGASDVEVRVLLKQFRKKASLSNDLWGRWMSEESEFSETIKQGREASERWWLRLGRGMSSGKIAGNSTTWIFNMKNRFSWADKREVENIMSTGTERGSVAIQAALEAKLASLGIELESVPDSDADAEVAEVGEAIH
tara:strand:+ start:1078 stop:1563 length:486 start_codon:yes stop_codon:yes gene_type:complete